MKYIFMLNSFSNRDVLKTYEKINEISKYLGIDYLIEVNSKFEFTEEILNRYKYSNDIIVPVGGDGMLNRVLNGIIDTDNLLSYLPNGTGNDFNRTVKETLSPGSNKIDVVRINDKYFMNVACFGIDADYSLFKYGGKVYIDGKEISDYSSKSGSTIISLNKNYLSKLDYGVHTMRVTFNNGNYAETNFTVLKEGSKKNPRTGDYLSFYIVLLVISIISLWLLKVFRKD